MTKEVSEFDQGGVLLATYSVGADGIAIKRIVKRKTIWEQGLDVFLPEGYPSSVSDDYLAYQTYDSLQAFASSIAGMLSSRAVLQGIGVGDEKSHPTTAILLSVFQQSFGRIATILFAHRLGSALEPECKMYRFAADIFNDAALILDCLSPAFPQPTRVVVFSAASMLRALCGVAAGSAKASLSAHFARGGNLGDVNAKDESQETVISLFGMLAGSVVVSHVESPLATWITLISLLILHLMLNYTAVRAVKMRTLNRQRANLVFSHLLAADKVLDPLQVSKREKLFERDGVLRWADGKSLGSARIGISVGQLIELQARQSRQANGKSSTCHRILDLALLLQTFEKQAYALVFTTEEDNNSCCSVKILLKQKCTPRTQLKAWFHALALAREVNDSPVGDGEDPHQLIRKSLESIEKRFGEYITRLEKAGWELDRCSLETHCGPRILP